MRLLFPKSYANCIHKPSGLFYLVPYLQLFHCSLIGDAFHDSKHFCSGSEFYRLLWILLLEDFFAKVVLFTQNKLSLSIYLKVWLIGGEILLLKPNFVLWCWASWLVTSCWEYTSGWPNCEQGVLRIVNKCIEMDEVFLIQVHKNVHKFLNIKYFEKL